MVKYGYRHRSISRFGVQSGDEFFEFKDSVLIIQNRGDEPDEVVENRNAAFLRAWQGLEMRDRNAIVKMEVVENEHAITEDDLKESRAVRGPVQTTDIKAPVAGQNIGSQDANKSTGVKIAGVGGNQTGGGTV